MNRLFASDLARNWAAMACAQAEQLINTALSYAAQSQGPGPGPGHGHGHGMFEDIAGKSLRVTSHLPPCDIVISCAASEIFVQAASDSLTDTLSKSQTDAQLSGSLPALICLAVETQSLNNSNATDSYDGPVKLSGDVEFIETLRERLQSIDIDWEAWLATFLGDIPAHVVGESARKAKQWQTQTMQRSSDGIENYFRNEWPSSPWQEAMGQFNETLVKLGSDRQQLQERLDRLKSRFLQIIG